MAEQATGTECNIFLNVLGTGNKISISHLKSFIIDEKFPNGKQIYLLTIFVIYKKFQLKYYYL